MYAWFHRYLFYTLFFCSTFAQVESLCAENLSLSLWLQGGALDRRPVPMPGMPGMPPALVAELLRERLVPGKKLGDLAMKHGNPMEMHGKYGNGLWK